MIEGERINWPGLQAHGHYFHWESKQAARKKSWLEYSWSARIFREPAHHLSPSLSFSLRPAPDPADESGQTSYQAAKERGSFAEYRIH
jgi:hypothetical protein